MTEVEFENEPEYFAYLDALRESGETNMFGATPYLQEEFGLCRAEANTVLTNWMKSKNEQRS